MAVVELVGLTKAYNGVVAVAQTDLKIASGEFFSLLGPSGCGKTTTLRMLAGFVTPDDGHILIDGDDITELPPEKRNIGIVFQNYAHLPAHERLRQHRLRPAHAQARQGRDRAAGRAAARQQVGLAGYETR